VLAQAAGGAEARPPQEPGGPAITDPAERAAARLCAMIEDAAGANGLPREFFTRLIWKESLFDVKAVSPKGAQGIAQFMPATARLRGLADPFDPVQAIPASAEYLAELRARFGNLGLAAAAYNSGEERVDNWLGGRGGLPGETLGYVHSITFRPASWFREPGREVEPRPLDKTLTFAEACRQLPVIRTRSVLFEGAEWQPWGVQVAGNIRQGAALRQFARLQSRYRRILGDASPMLVRARSGVGPKRIWSVRIGADSRHAANRLCTRLRTAGGACVVRRN
jgi:hypothetical protein